MSKRAIVSLATERGNYYQSLARLGDSLKGKFDGDFFGFMGEHSVGAPKHLENPYAFKLYAIAEVLDKGYDQVLWLDSSVYAIKNVSPIFDIIEAQGYVMQDSGHYIGNWASDTQLETFSLSRDKAMTMSMYGNAGLLGIDHDSIKGMGFFHTWSRHMQNGLFKGSWTNENKTESNDERCFGCRHDMVIGSILAHKFKMHYHPGDQLLQYASPEETPINDSIIFFAQGI